MNSVPKISGWQLWNRPGKQSVQFRIRNQGATERMSSRRMKDFKWWKD